MTLLGPTAFRSPSDGGARIHMYDDAEIRKKGRGRTARAPRSLVIYKERGISCSAVVVDTTTAGLIIEARQPLLHNEEGANVKRYMFGRFFFMRLFASKRQT